MRINQIQISPLNNINVFRAKLTRNTVYAKNNKGETYNKSTTKKEMVESYNNQIRALRAQREAAIELDNFMRTDNMKYCLNKLPKGDEIEILNKFETMSVDEDGSVDFNPLCLMYKFEDPISQRKVEDAEYLHSNKAQELSMCYPQREDGSIDKQKIADYILSIGRFLGVAKR